MTIDFTHFTWLAEQIELEARDKKCKDDHFGQSSYAQDSIRCALKPNGNDPDEAA